MKSFLWNHKDIHVHRGLQIAKAGLHLPAQTIRLSQLLLRVEPRSRCPRQRPVSRTHSAKRLVQVVNSAS